MEVLLLSIGLVGVAFLALGINIFFRREGKFPETEIGHNKHMRELGITCTKCDERKKWNDARNKRRVVQIPSELGIDFSQMR